MLALPRALGGRSSSCLGAVLKESAANRILLNIPPNFGGMLSMQMDMRTVRIAGQGESLKLSRSLTVEERKRGRRAGSTEEGDG